MKRFFEITALTGLLLTLATLGIALITSEEEGPSQALRSAMALYNAGDYEGAIEPLIEAQADALAIGNAYYFAGEGLEDGHQQMAMYQSAVEAYETGIIEAPQRTDLKYNYAFVKDLLTKAQEQANQENESGGEQGQDEKDDGAKEGKEENAGDGQQDEGDQGQKGNEAGQEASEQEASDQGQAPPKDEEGAEGQPSSPEASEGQEEGAQDAKTGDEAQEALTDQALEQILELLEQQEADSLKNNQNVVQGEQGNDNDW